MKEYDIISLQHQVKKKLPFKRFCHTMGVAHTAANLAVCHGGDMEQAFLAGLFHDIAKCYDDKELLEKAKKIGLNITVSESDAPYLLHGKVGAWQAVHKYGIEDEEIADAIRYHTTGRPDMSLLGKIIFTADYIEPMRTIIPGLTEVRKMAFKDIDEAVYMILKDSIEYLKVKKTIDPMTEKTYDFYRKGRTMPEMR